MAPNNRDIRRQGSKKSQPTNMFTIPDNCALPAKTKTSPTTQLCTDNFGTLKALPDIMPAATAAQWAIPTQWVNPGQGMRLGEGEMPGRVRVSAHIAMHYSTTFYCSL